MKPFPWRPGMLTHTTHPGGFPCCPAGAPIRVETPGALEDCVVEGMFGPITPEPSHHHPDFERLCALHDADMEAAWARVLPAGDDPATLGALLGAVEEAWAPVGVITVVHPVAASMGEPWRLRLTTMLGDFWPIRSAPTRFDVLVAAWWGAP